MPGKIILAGIDYSMTCPAITVFEGATEWKPKHCKFYFAAHDSKYPGNYNDIRLMGELLPSFDRNETRFNTIGDWAIDVLKLFHEVNFVGMESYSFGSKGRTFHIAENTGLLKHKMWQKHIEFDVYAPTTIKKFATGSGRAKKPEMVEAFTKETGIDVRSVLGIKTKNIGSPEGDIADSYFICKYTHSLLFP